MSNTFKDWFCSLWKLGYSFQIEAEVAGDAILVNVLCVENKRKKYFFFTNEKYFNKFIDDLKGVISELW